MKRATMILWGRSPDYANGRWIKLCRWPATAQRRWREKRGWECVSLAFGQHPEDHEETRP